MQKKTWWIIAAIVLCIAILGVTVWCVWSGVQSVLPEPMTEEPEQQEDVGSVPPDVTEDLVPEIDENGNLIEDNLVVDPWFTNPTDEGQTAEDNAVVDPWSEAPEQQEETSETPADEDESSEDLSVSDEGWTGIY